MMTDGLVVMQEKDLTSIQPASMDVLQSYVEGTAGSLAYLALETLRVKDVKVDHAAGHLGLCYSLCFFTNIILLFASLLA